MERTLYIMQGVPGSGKSYTARLLAGGKPDFIIYSTDDYFLDWDGVYRFDRSKLEEYHKRNQEHAISALQSIPRLSVIIDNCNIRRWECRPYVAAAFELKVPVVFIRVNGPFKSTHGVPDDVVERMKYQMEDLTLESVMRTVLHRKES